MTASSLVLSERLEAFRRSDEERDTLFQDLVHELEEVRHKLNLLQDDYGNETDSRRRLQQTIRALEVDLSEQKRAVVSACAPADAPDILHARMGRLTFQMQQESNNLIYAIIDGDGAVFKDELLARGKDGGAEAANELLAEIRKHLHTLHPDATIEDWGIIVQVYLNLEGMSRKLMACNLVKNTKEVLDFARGFTNAQPLFSFVDVGPGKELADHKMREMLRAVVRNRQVRHVVLGPCHDNGYLPVLRPYNSEPATSQKITLLDTTPAQPGFADLAALQAPHPARRLPVRAPARPPGAPARGHQRRGGRVAQPLARHHGERGVSGVGARQLARPDAHHELGVHDKVARRKCSRWRRRRHRRWGQEGQAAAILPAK